MPEDAGSRAADPAAAVISLDETITADDSTPDIAAQALTDLAQEIKAQRPVSRLAIPLALIKDGGAQMRVEMHPETIADYAADMLDGAVFPPVVLYHDGEVYWLADGFHRVEAARKIDRSEIEAEIREGTARDAILHGIGANARHGLRRTQPDKRRAVERLLTDPEWATWSDRKIAQLAKVDHKTVGKIRRELSGEIPTPKPMSGDFPTLSGKPNERGSLLADVLRGVPDDLLVAECRRRGLIVEGGGDA